MIKTDAVNIFPFNKIKNIFQLFDIMMIDRKAQADTLVNGYTVFNSLHGGSKGSVHPTELVIYILQSVERNADIANANIFDSLRHFRCNQGPIGR